MVRGARCTVDSERWTVHGRRWTVDGGWWTLDGARQTVNGGRWTVEACVYMVRTFDSGEQGRAVNAIYGRGQHLSLTLSIGPIPWFVIRGDIRPRAAIGWKTRTYVYEPSPITQVLDVLQPIVDLYFTPCIKI